MHMLGALAGPARHAEVTYAGHLGMPLPPGRTDGAEYGRITGAMARRTPCRLESCQKQILRLARL